MTTDEGLAEDMTGDNWDDIAGWWLSEIADDPIYLTDVHPLYASLVSGLAGSFVELGCGDGQAFGLLPQPVYGVDLSHKLLTEALPSAPVARGRAPDLAWLRTDAVAHAGAVYLLDLIEAHDVFFREVARVVQPCGTLSIVINHPVYTAPGSAPIADADGEVLWRWGAYPSVGSTHEAAGGRTVEFFHRPMDVLLTSAAAAGWNLDRMVERPLSPEAIEGQPGYLGQDTVPRLLGVRWSLPDGS